jgi:hypothetical protein
MSVGLTPGMVCVTLTCVEGLLPPFAGGAL